MTEKRGGKQIQKKSEETQTGFQLLYGGWLSDVNQPPTDERHTTYRTVNASKDKNP